MMGNIFGRHTGSQKALSNLNALFFPHLFPQFYLHTTHLRFHYFLNGFIDFLF